MQTESSPQYLTTSQFSPSPQLKQMESEAKQFSSSEVEISVPLMTDYSEATSLNDYRVEKVQHTDKVEYNEQFS